ncbi:hypothetical protein PMZ80_009494 [Knufia obscura]|uniref:Cobalamin-independent methionine synthase MetE C-terminal/archaeal domain-containing protein n=2 Tax=Knufia TaxID=430999 RepID=A0AAN8EEF6_9EURO|nr:hypothetical protein PMZ80_009494 [Knufia obscura]KAK5949568.1 hypothetical protein OHC33_009375 [Knufia fluminis]
MPPAYRVDHIGSLLRPQALLDARADKDLTKTYPPEVTEAINKAEVDAVKIALNEQITRQIYPLTNGEYPRAIFYSGLFENLKGMTTFPSLPIPDAFRTDFPTTTGLLKTFGLKTRSCVIATDKIRFNESSPPYLAEWRQLRDLLPDQSLLSKAKITIPAPSWQHIQLKPGTAYTPESGYRNDEAYFRDLASCFTRAITTLYDHGCRFIQIDDPHLTYFCDASFLSGCAKDGTSTDDLLDLYIKVYSWIFQPIKSDSKYSDLRVGMHLCRGNMVGSHHWVSGGYEKIAKKLFNDTVGIDTFYLEFDDEERAGGFEPLRYLPRGKNVVLGLVSTKVADLEDKEVLVRKVKEAGKIIADAFGVGEKEAIDEALAISPQCGFSSHSMKGGKGMTWDRQWEKLELLGDVAREIWGMT